MLKVYSALQTAFMSVTNVVNVQLQIHFPGVLFNVQLQMHFPDVLFNVQLQMHFPDVFF